MIAAAFVVSIVCVVALTLLFRYVVVTAGRRAGERIAPMLRALEQIVEQGRVPAAWAAELRRTVPGAFEHPARQVDEARRWLLGRLAAMRRFCERSSVVDGPETLEVLRDGLARVEREWQERGLEDILRDTHEEATE